MKARAFIITAVLLMVSVSVPDLSAQFNLGKAISSGVKGIQALTITDQQMAEYSRQSVESMDHANKVSDSNSEYTVRLKRLTEGMTEVEGIPLNFKVYEVRDVNAFACPDGSVRVFSALMDIMNDDELVGIIGHEIGHVAKHHSKKAFKQQLLNEALRDALASAGGTLATLSESQLGALGQALAGAKYSQKQEKEADDYGYEFLKKNGRNPWGIIMSFEKLQSLEGSGSTANYFQKMFSSHPDTKERIDRLTKRAKKEGITRPVN